MTRIVPLTGTEEERQLVTGSILPNEIHTTSDHKRVFLQNVPIAPVYHGEVASEAAMLALRYTSPRGCFAGDMCKRTDVPTATFYLCVSRDGREAVDWVQITRTVSFLNLTDSPSSYAGQASKFVRVNAAGNALEFVDAPSGGGGGADLREVWLKG